VQGVGSEAAKAISNWRETIPWEEELQAVEKLGLQLISSENPNYPIHLREIHDTPLILYVTGTLESQEKNSLAIVGMRHPTNYGQQVARTFGYQLGNIGMSVVSGLALGIDSAAHRGCLQAKGHTVAVLGFGFQYLSKANNASLANEIVNQGGAVLTEFPITRPPDRQTFPMRNRIVSGMTIGTLVIEAGTRSGALITSHLATEQGRQVFAVPGRIDSEQSKGCHKLVQDGAKLVQSIDDVLEEFEHLIPSRTTLASEKTDETISPPTIRLTQTEQVVFEAIGSEETEIDAITATCELPPSVVSSTLMVLEMKRAIRQLPGKRYQKRGQMIPV
jgi:DNA processing protein